MNNKPSTFDHFKCFLAFIGGLIAALFVWCGKLLHKVANKISYKVYANIATVMLVVCFGLLIQTRNELKEAQHTTVVAEQRLADSTKKVVVAKAEIRDLRAHVEDLTAEVSSLKLAVANASVEQENFRAEGKITLAVLNRNPMNVKVSGNGPWKGQVGVDKFGHAKFIYWSDGFRAGAKVLKKYAEEHKIDTLNALIARFCTGNRDEYITFLSKRLKLRPNEKFNLAGRLPEVMRAMARFESGQEFPEYFFRPYDLVASR